MEEDPFAVFNLNQHSLPRHTAFHDEDDITVDAHKSSAVGTKLKFRATATDEDIGINDNEEDGLFEVSRIPTDRTEADDVVPSITLVFPTTSYVELSSLLLHHYWNSDSLDFPQSAMILFQI